MRTRRDFTAAVRRGRRAGRGCVVVHLARPDGAPAGAARVGFVVSRAVGAAVRRNQVKRRLRHLAGDRMDRLPPGSLLVVRAMPGAASASYVELGRDLDGGLASVLRRRPGGVDGR